MKKLIKLILVLFSLLSFGCAGTGERHALGMLGIASYQNEPDGFRGIRWGQEIGTLKGMQFLLRDKDGLSIYIRDNDSMTLGEATLSSVRYLFWQNKFVEAQMSADSDQLGALRNVLFEKYGEGYNHYGPSSSIHDYSWHGPVANVGLKRLGSNSSCDVWITSREISDQRSYTLKNRSKVQARKGAEKDF